MNETIETYYPLIKEKIEKDFKYLNYGDFNYSIRFVQTYNTLFFHIYHVIKKLSDKYPYIEKKYSYHILYVKFDEEMWTDFQVNYLPEMSFSSFLDLLIDRYNDLISQYETNYQNYSKKNEYINNYGF